MPFLIMNVCIVSAGISLKLMRQFLYCVGPKSVNQMIIVESGTDQNLKGNQHVRMAPTRFQVSKY